MPPPRAEARRGDLAIASLAVFLAAADTYVVVLALPDIMTGVGLGLDELARASPIVSMFLLGYVSVLPLIGRVSDLRGRVPVLVACLLLFAIGSLLTASADGLGLVVAGRALQGAGGGGVVPVALALVADLWTPDRRGVPLGIVGAVQEVGSVAGPLYGAGVLAVAGWRTIFWANLSGSAVLLAVLAVRRWTEGHTSGLPRIRLAGVLTVLAVAAWCLLLVAPRSLTDDPLVGALYVPVVAGSAWSAPLVLVALALTAAVACCRSARVSVVRLVQDSDVLGATLLGLALGGVVLAFAAADPSRQVMADGGPVLLAGTVVCAGLFVVRQRTAAQPLVPPGALGHRAAWGALCTNVLVGAALVAALVHVPVFARTTAYPDSQLGAALVLLRMLVAIPVGAVLGGRATQRLSARVVAATAMVVAAAGFAAMTQWDESALSGPASTIALVVTGLGFGLAIPPVNAALLAATAPAMHGLASALVVVARMVGMLVGLSVLTAVGLRVFYTQQEQIGSPLTICPDSPLHCPAYEAATRAALLDQLHAVFAGAGVFALLAAILALALMHGEHR